MIEIFVNALNAEPIGWLLLSSILNHNERWHCFLYVLRTFTWVIVCNLMVFFYELYDMFIWLVIIINRSYRMCVIYLYNTTRRWLISVNKIKLILIAQKNFLDTFLQYAFGIRSSIDTFLINWKPENWKIIKKTYKSFQ